MQDRVLYLLDTFRRHELHSLSRSGTVEEYGRREELLTELDAQAREAQRERADVKDAERRRRDREDAAAASLLAVAMGGSHS